MTDRHRFRVRYQGGRPITVKGPVTGVMYHFSGMQRMQAVDPRDAVIMTKDRLFRVDGIIEMNGP